MEELKAQLANVEQQIADEKAKGADRDNALISTLEHQQADILLKMDEAAKKAEVQAAVQTNQSAMVDSLTQIDLGDGSTASIYDYTSTEEDANFLIAVFNEKIAQITAQATIQAQAYKQEMDAKDDRILELSKDNQTLQAMNDKLGLDNADLQAKRDAAAAQLQEKDEEIARLTKEGQDLREQMVKPAATNMNANLKELAEKAKAARPKVYNVQWYDEPRRTKYTAKQAANGEDIIFGRLELGKYNVITEEEALQFRNSQPSEDEPAQTEPVQEAPVQDTPLDNGVIEPPPFQEGPENTVPEANDGAVGGDAPVSEVVEEPVTRAEFEALKRDVEALKQGQAGVVA